MRIVRLLAACMLCAAALACSRQRGPTEPGKPVTTGLTCRRSNGSSVGCALSLAGKSSVTITLVGTSCVWHGDKVRVTKPAAIATALLDDGCYTAPGATWTFAGPFTEDLSLEVESGLLSATPALQANGTASPWTVNFDDGYGDNDFNDIVLRVETK